MAVQLPRQFRLRGLSAVRAHSVLASVLRNMRFDWRQFGHLMPPRFALRCDLPAVAGEFALAMTAVLRQQIDHLIDAIRRRQSAPMSAMTGLATRLATALLPSAASFAL